MFATYSYRISRVPLPGTVPGTWYLVPGTRYGVTGTGSYVSLSWYVLELHGNLVGNKLHSHAGRGSSCWCSHTDLLRIVGNARLLLDCLLSPIW
jgi:hypothetical protein